MTRDEFARLGTVEPEVRMVEAPPGHDATLLYGFDTDNRTWHVYRDAGHLHLLVYGRDGETPHRHEHGREMPAAGLVPDKRLYPEGCDLGFCATLRRIGVPLPFTGFGGMGARPEGSRVVGKTHRDFPPVPRLGP